METRYVLKSQMTSELGPMGFEEPRQTCWRTCKHLEAESSCRILFRKSTLVPRPTPCTRFKKKMLDLSSPFIEDPQCWANCHSKYFRMFKTPAGEEQSIYESYTPSQARSVLVASPHHYLSLREYIRRPPLPSQWIRNERDWCLSKRF